MSPGKKKVVQQRKRRPGLRYLAEKVGVSHTAVARALQNDPKLSEALRKRIHEVARREGYFTSDIAQGLITGWTGTIGVVFPRIVSPFVSDITEGIVESLWEDETIPLMLSSEHDVAREEKMLEALARKRVGGVIIMPCREDRDESHFIHLLDQHTPIVVLDTQIPQINAPLVTTDNQLGAKLATEHLIELGHRHIVHMGAPLDNKLADRRREKGYAQAMREAGLKPSVINSPGRRPGIQDVVDILDDFFTTPQGRKTTAIFAFNDPHAICIYHYARRQGRKIGQDLAVVGFSNAFVFPKGLPDETSVLQPTLSTVEQYPKRLGQTAVEVLRNMVANKPVPPQTLIEPKLIIRESSGKAIA